ncbi:MAG: hypothetical protein N2Z20_03885 [Elusimicrobiales bacterium]|nr:hypothetical protein [Elusimicrobiales bacterium]
MKTKDYFPLKEKTRYEYEFKSTEFEGVATVYIDIIKVSKKGKVISADARMIFRLRDENITEFKIKKDNKWVITTDGIVVGGRKEFPLPLYEGKKWDEYPDYNEVISMTDKVSVKAGKFSNCLKIMTKISGGDGGISFRYYAPGIGYILEDWKGEDRQMYCELVSIKTLKDSEIEVKKGRRK